MTTGKRVMMYACVFMAGCIFAVMTSCMFDIMKVNGASMDPAVTDGSHVLINRMAYFFGTPDTGDVVAFECDVYSEDGEGNVLLRRVAATQGDNVCIKDGNLYVNGSIYEAYAEAGVYLDPMEEQTIGKNRVFVISDSGQAVLDSRDSAVGQLRTDELLGKVWFK